MGCAGLDGDRMSLIRHAESKGVFVSMQKPSFICWFVLKCGDNELQRERDRERAQAARAIILIASMQEG